MGVNSTLQYIAFSGAHCVVLLIAAWFLCVGDPNCISSRIPWRYIKRCSDLFAMLANGYRLGMVRHSYKGFNNLFFVLSFLFMLEASEENREGH